jgi:hypothetical protein
MLIHELSLRAESFQLPSENRHTMGFSTFSRWLLSLCTRLAYGPVVDIASASHIFYEGRSIPTLRKKLGIDPSRQADLHDHNKSQGE